MSKIIKENCKELSIYRLKEWGYFEAGWRKNGGITWTSPNGDKSNISFVVDLGEQNDMFIEVDYRVKNWGEDEWTNIKQKYPIVATTCNYGGVRYWFECSIYHNGVYCGRRVAKLYLGAGSKYFACRHCYGLTYRSRLEGFAYTAPYLDEYAEKTKRWYYNGKPTRRHRQYIKKENSMMRYWARFLFKANERMDGRINK
ncbi:hypothetical protein ACFL23_00170 [Patescibacteria group bacterium]